MTKNKIQPTIGYNHLDVGHPNNPKPFRICGAHTKQDVALYEYCTQAAGWGTSHAGVGRCKLHGGAIPMRPNRYSNLWRDRMKQIAIETLEQEDSDPLDLLAELDVQRVLLAVMIDRLNGGSGAPNGDDELSRHVRAVLNESGSSGNANISNTVGGGGVVNNSSEVSSVVGGHAEFLSSDSENVSKIEWVMQNAELVQQIRQQLNDIVTTVTRIIAQRNQTAITKAEVTWLVMMLKEGMDKFVPKENQEAYVRWMLENIPGQRRVELEASYESNE